MGGESPRISIPLSGELAVGMPQLAEAAEALVARHDLKGAKLEELLDYLFGLSCRDQETAAFDPERMAERRRRGFALAKSMQKEATAMLASLERLYSDWCKFDDEVQSRPALLEAIFDVDTGGPGKLFLPPEINILQSLFRTSDDDAADELREPTAERPNLEVLSPEDPCPAGFWEAADRRLLAVVNMPVRTRLPGGPVPNTVVRDALDACRGCWVSPSRRWSMSGLKIAAVRQENVIANLTGACEQFVADALTTAGVKFNLSELHNAWEAIDAAARRPVGTPSLE
jgi:hypothetical protein